MRLTAALAIPTAFLLGLVACIQSGGLNAPAAVPIAVSPTVVIETHTPSPTAALSPTHNPSPTAMPSPTPTPTPPATPTTVSPTATPQATATPPPTATATPVPTATPQPTALPPTPVPPPPESNVIDLGGGTFLSVTPQQQFAGRGVSLALSGLPPWQPVTVSFIDPQSVAAAWITADDVHLLDRDGAEATSYLMYPTESGRLDWERHGVQDEPGDWSVDINLNGSLSSTTYSITELQLSGHDGVTIGANLTQNRGLHSTVYYSELVPTALMVDLREHLSATALLMERRTGTEIGQLPDLYLLGNREIMERVAAATGVVLGFEDGYFKSFGTRPGIYMRTDLLSTGVRRLLTHEYVHLVFDDLAGGRKLPAWLTEGLSRYYEYDFALSGPRASASQLRLFSDADLARTAAQQGRLFSLTTMDSQSDWNSRANPDEVPLQYAQAYMAVRFLIETYGARSAQDLVEEIGRGIGLPDSIRVVTGLNLAMFETRFNLWLKDWEDPVRASISAYLAFLKPILAGQEEILDQRSKDLNSAMSPDQAAIRRLALVKSTETLLKGLESLEPPEAAAALHQEIKEYLGRVVDWLTLEFQHADTVDDFYRINANAMIPARQFLFQRNMSNLEFVFHLRE